MTAKKCLQLVGVAVLLAGVGGAGWIANHLWGSPSHSPGQAETPADEGDGVVCIGLVDVESGVRSLAPLRPGRVAEVLVKESDAVEAGAVLLRLEDRDARLERDEAEAALAAAVAQREQAEQLVEQQRARLAEQEAAIEAAGFRVSAARELLAHKEELRQEKVVRAADVAAAREQVKALEAARRAEQEKLAEIRASDPAPVVSKARAEVRLAEARLERARRQVEECVLKAPCAGIVQRVGVGAGDVLTGMPGQPVLRFCPAGPRLVRVEVDQEFADRVRVGQAALAKDDARGGPGWHGKVLRVADWFDRRRPNPQDPSAFADVRAVECLIAIDPGQAPLRIGQRMRVLIGPVPVGTGE
jgi:multidrug resistance efflux pump